MNFRKIMSLMLAVWMLCSVLCACQPGQTGSTPSTSESNPDGPQKDTALYQVAVYGADGKPATSGVVVRFMQNGEQVAMQSMNANGVAEKELEKGDYTVELKFTNNDVEYYFDATDLTLSKTKTQLMIHLCLKQSEEGQEVYVNDPETEESIAYTAYPLYTGNTYVTLKPGRNYFLFTPTESGEYQWYTKDGYVTGYYGGEHYIMSNNVGEEAPNNGAALSISPGMATGGQTLVIGVDNPGTDDVQTILYALRVSDYIDTSIPVEIYKTTAALNPWKLPAGKQVKKFDITATVPYKLVLDEATGFYHLNSVTGPLVVVFLGQNAAQYMDYLVPYDTILKNASVCAYFQNDDGTYSKREEYAPCLLDYIGVWDENAMKYTSEGCIDRESGLYPLTEDLKYIIQQHGNYSGWWDVDDERYIFDGITVNKENAWLFMCGYLG